jgi:Protein of unknown function (DUF4199)
MKKTIFIYGILAGIAAAAYGFLVYSIQKATFLSMTFYATSMFIYAFLMYFAAIKAKNEDFKVVLRTAFAVFLIANVVYYCFDFALFKHIDTSLATMQADAAIAYLKPNTLLEEQIKMEENIRSSDIHNVESLFKQYLKASIGGFILSFLIAYLIKRK